MRFTFQDAAGRPDIFHTTNEIMAIDYASRHGLVMLADGAVPLTRVKRIVPNRIIFVGRAA